MWRVLRDLPAYNQVLILGVALNRMASFVQVFLVLYLTTTRQWPVAVAGAALTAYGAGAVVGLLSGGVIAGRLGCRAAIVLSMFGAGLSVGALPHVRGVGGVLLLSGLAGATTQLFRPAAMTLLTAAVPPERLVLLTAGYRLGLNVGATLTPLAGTALATHSYELVFSVDAVSSLAFGFVALAMLPAGRQLPAVDAGTPTRSARSRTRAREGDHRPLRDRRFLLFTMGMFLIAMVKVQYVATLPLEVIARGLPESVFGSLVALNGLLVIVAEPPLTRSLQSWPPHRALVIGVTLIGAGIAAYGLPGPAAVLVAATVLWTVGEMIGAPPAGSYPALIAPISARSRYLAVSAGAQGAGYALGPALGTAAYARAPGFFWVGCASVGLLAATACRAGTRAPIPVPATAASAADEREPSPGR